MNDYEIDAKKLEEMVEKVIENAEKMTSMMSNTGDLLNKVSIKRSQLESDKEKSEKIMEAYRNLPLSMVNQADVDKTKADIEDKEKQIKQIDDFKNVYENAIKDIKKQEKEITDKYNKRKEEVDKRKQELEEKKNEIKTQYATITSNEQVRIQACDDEIAKLDKEIEEIENQIEKNKNSREVILKRIRVKLRSKGLEGLIKEENKVEENKKEESKKSETKVDEPKEEFDFSADIDKIKEERKIINNLDINSAESNRETNGVKMSYTTQKDNLVHDDVATYGGDNVYKILKTLGIEDKGEKVADGGYVYKGNDELVRTLLTGDPNIIKVLKNQSEAQLKEYAEMLRDNGADKNKKYSFNLSYDIRNLSKSGLSAEGRKELEKMAYEHRKIADVKVNVFQRVKFAFWGLRDRIGSNKNNRVEALPAGNVTEKHDDLAVNNYMVKDNDAIEKIANNDATEVRFNSDYINKINSFVGNLKVENPDGHIEKNANNNLSKYGSLNNEKEKTE